MLMETLELAQLGPKEEHLLTLLADPRRTRDSLTTIARDAGLKMGQVIELFRSAAFTKAHTLSIAKATAALPGVVDDLAAKSVDTKVECPSCFGAGLLGQAQCPTCFGKGLVMRYSSLDSQKTLLEVGGLTKKPSSGVSVQVNTQVNNNQAPTNYFSRWVKDSDTAAYDVTDHNKATNDKPNPKVIDAEVVKPNE